MLKATRCKYLNPQIFPASKNDEVHTLFGNMSMSVNVMCYRSVTVAYYFIIECKSSFSVKYVSVMFLRYCYVMVTNTGVYMLINC